jgi:hypothetical protein
MAHRTHAVQNLASEAMHLGVDVGYRNPGWGSEPSVDRVGRAETLCCAGVVGDWGRPVNSHQVGPQHDRCLMDPAVLVALNFVWADTASSVWL